MILAAMEDRARMLKAGFTGKQIEALFFVLNRFENMGVDWNEAAVKPPCFLIPLGIISSGEHNAFVGGTIAAPSHVEEMTA